MPSPAGQSPHEAPTLQRWVPWWGVVSAVVAPLAFNGGWLYAGSLVPGYDPVRSSISDLAAQEAPNRWVMTVALLLTGLAHVVTAVGMRPADVAGRTLLGVGGVATMLAAWIPNTLVGHNAVGHMIATYLGLVALSVWPAVIARDVPAAPFVLQRRFGPGVTVCLGVLILVVVASFALGAAILGLAERLLTSVQSVLPLVVVAGLVDWRMRAGD